MYKNKLLKKSPGKAGLNLPPVEDPNGSKIKTILEVDPDFYSLVDGRPIRPDTSIRKYKQNIKDVALKRTLHGLLVDEILRIDRDIKTERKIYETASTHFYECQESFNKFLADDNDKTIIIMRNSDSLDKELSNQIEQHKKAIYDFASLKSKLQYIDETLQILLSFQNFLFNAAPILWRDSQELKLVTGQLEIFTMDTDIFNEIDVNLISERLKKMPPPRLYFKTPEQIQIIFELLEKQNLNYLLKTEELRSEKNKFVKSSILLKTLLRHELDYIKDKICEIEKCIEENERREIELKREFYRILEDKFKFLVSSKAPLQIFNYVEFAYEQLIAPNETNLSTLDLVLALEQEYNNIMLDLSTFDLSLIKCIEKNTYEEEIKETKLAKEAAKLLKDVEKLSKKLKSSYELAKK
ncbi:unnamed protein product [Parnassius apollo]|uniref:(apollo) hypothetical protein n=1 Tax=Parnassius apollo TaxID=110799 RepID=A0A8S3XKE9_PARAO|nr:unnamed protein product [Parnassius apollo]